MLVSILILLLGLLVVQTVTAQDNIAKLSFKGTPGYTLTSDIERDGKIIGRTYRIDVYIQNTGKITSFETLVNLSDEEGFELTNSTYIEPGETKTVSFTWSTMSDYDQTLKINFFPKNLNIRSNEYNTGSTSVKLIIGDEDKLTATNTPGFEAILLLCLIGLAIIYLKKRK